MPSSAATSTASAVAGFVTDAQRNARPASPCSRDHLSVRDDAGGDVLRGPLVDLAQSFHGGGY